MPTQIFVRNVAGVIFLLGNTVTFADVAEKNLAVKVGAGYSDNIDKQESNKKDEFITGAGIDFTLRKDTRRLSINTTADLEYLDYQTNLYDGVVGNFSGLANFKLMPERFEWIIQDNFGQVLNDPFAPSTPDNRQNINYFTTGPDFTAHLTNMTSVKLEGRYSKVSYEDSPLGSNRLGAAISLLHQLSASTVVSGNIQTEKTNYDSTFVDSEYSRHDAFLGYAAAGSRTSFDMDLGYSILDRKNAAGNDKGVLAKLEVSRQLTPMSKLSLRIGREFSDAGASFRLQQNIGNQDYGSPSILQTTAPFSSQYAALGWDSNGRRTGLGVSGLFLDESYEQQSILDRKRTVLGAYIYRLLTTSLRFELRGDSTREDYKNLSNDFQDIGGSTILDWQTTRRVRLVFRYEYTERKAANSGLFQYRENRVWLQFVYGVSKESIPVSMQP